MDIDRLLEVKLARSGLNILAEQAVGHTATVFGATGFLGRYVVSRLGVKALESQVEIAIADCIKPRKGVPWLCPSGMPWQNGI